MKTWTRERKVIGGIYEDIYDVEILWKLTESLGVEYLQMSEFKNEFHAKSWIERDSEGREIFIAPCEVVLNPSAHPIHAEKIRNAQLKYPILVTDTLEPMIIDGIHRLCQAESLKFQMMPVKYVDSQTLEKALISKKFYATI
jgi:hypothetical protein